VSVLPRLKRQGAITSEWGTQKTMAGFGFTHSRGPVGSSCRLNLRAGKRRRDHCRFLAVNEETRSCTC
jgi:hypothetical protein